MYPVDEDERNVYPTIHEPSIQSIGNRKSEEENEQTPMSQETSLDLQLLLDA